LTYSRNVLCARVIKDTGNWLGFFHLCSIWNQYKDQYARNRKSELTLIA
jgi:hypothetical protein